MWIGETTIFAGAADPVPGLSGRHILTHPPNILVVKCPYNLHTYYLRELSCMSMTKFDYNLHNIYKNKMNYLRIYYVIGKFLKKKLFRHP